MNGITMTVTYFDAILKLLTKLGMGVTEQTEMALEKMASSRLSTSDESLPQTQQSQSDAITNDTIGFTLSKQNQSTTRIFW
jgi:hypothetical protein